MMNTTYVNASGLPDDAQVTTAKDQATLGRAIQERFPRYYRYFSTEAFVYRGETMRNHNHLLGAVEGVDDIKTGYTRTSGFNLMTSVHRFRRWCCQRHCGITQQSGILEKTLRQLRVPKRLRW
jgi:D-alanyl-D-alanine carboxypeptidase